MPELFFDVETTGLPSNVSPSSMNAREDVMILPRFSDQAGLGSVVNFQNRGWHVQNRILGDRLQVANSLFEGSAP